MVERLNTNVKNMDDVRRALQRIQLFYVDEFGDYLKKDGTTPLTGNWDAGAFDITVGGDLNVDSDIICVGSGKTLNIHMDTSDGSDDGVVLFAGGGAFGQTRGGCIAAYGNDHAIGQVRGNVSIIAGTGTLAGGS